MELEKNLLNAKNENIVLCLSKEFSVIGMNHKFRYMFNGCDLGKDYLDYCANYYKEPIISTFPDKEVTFKFLDLDGVPYKFEIINCDNMYVIIGKNYHKERNLRQKLENKLERIVDQKVDENTSIEVLVQTLIEFYEYLLHHIPGNVYWLDKDCVTLGCNKNVLDFVGLEKVDDFIGITYEKMGEIAGWSAEVSQSFKADDMSVIKTGTPINAKEEMPIKLKNGEIAYYVSNRVPIKSPCQIIGVMGISIDITELRETQIKLENAVEDAKAAAKTKIAVVHNMRHDWLTPFTGIYTINEMLAKEETDPEKKEMLQMATESAELLLQHTESILDMIEAADGLLAVTEQLMNPWAICRNVYKIFKPLTVTKNIKFTLELNESNQPDVIGDPKRVERILLALVSNAIKFTESGGAVSIKLFVASDNGKVIQLNLTVADTGIGLTEDQITQIYEPLYRASPAYEAQYKGAGTGLTIVKKYIADIKGQIACQSSPGNGAKFIVAIPFKRSIITLDELNSD